MAVLSTDLLMIERSGTLYKTPVSDLPSGGGGGGTAGITLIQQEVISTAVSAVDFDLPAEYSRYKIYLDRVRSPVGDLRVSISLNNGASFEASNYASRAEMERFSNSTTGLVRSSSYQNIYLAVTSYSESYFSGCFDISNKSNSFSIWGNHVGIASTVFHGTTNASGYRLQTTKATTLRVYSGAPYNNFTGGTFSLYAYKEAP